MRRRSASTQYFEMFANRGIYHDGWYACTTPPAPPWSMGTAKLPDVNEYKWELYNIAEDFSQNNDLAARNPEKLKELQALFLSEAAKYQVLPLDNSILPRLISATAERDGRENGLHLLGSECRHSRRQCAEPPEQGLHDHRRGDDSQERRGGNDRDDGRPLRRLRALPAQGQAGLRLQPPQPEAVSLGGRRRRRDWLGGSLKPGKHTIVFDFKLDGPGFGKGGTGVLSVDGKELSRQKIEHTIPFLMAIDESFDIGSDTRTSVDDSYKLPFRFTGTIDKLTYKLGQEQIDGRGANTMRKALAKAGTSGRGVRSCRRSRGAVRRQRASRLAQPTLIALDELLPPAEPPLEVRRGCRRLFLEQLVRRVARLLDQRDVLFEIGEAQQRHAGLPRAEKLARAADDEVLRAISKPSVFSKITLSRAFAVSVSGSSNSR